MNEQDMNARNSALSALYPTDLPSWRALEAHYHDAGASLSLKKLFARDSARFEKFSVASDGLLLDYSKNLLSSETLDLLLQLAAETKVAQAVEAMFSGDHINSTENRPALHVALRSNPKDAVAPAVPGVSGIWSTLERMGSFVNNVLRGSILGATGKRLTQIVNIGIGGSDLGPVMACRALRPYWQPGMKFHSVSNVDGTQLVDLAGELDPEETLFVVCSKTFTTQETMVNAGAARRWIIENLGESAVSSHFAAASTNHGAMDIFGVNPDYRFGFHDWVGGRYSLWSPVGLSLALVAGMDNFRQLLAGGRSMDLHFRNTAAPENMPLLLALISTWYNNFLGAGSHAILPYDNRLDRFPAYLQQLQMESNGKCVRSDGQPCPVNTSQVIWGEAGSNAQHSFYQLLHQGTRLVPCDFILPVESPGAARGQQDLAIANCLAQSQALMEGFESADAFRRHPGNRPSSTILFKALTPETLGQLIALYEHKVFVESVIWGINPFDQFGVELGKKLASSLGDAVSGDQEYTGQNESTRQLLKTIKKLR